jgi:hypothetical protein
MNLRRRAFWLAASLLLTAIVVFWFNRGTSLSLERNHGTMGRVFVSATRQSSAGLKIAGAPALIDEISRVGLTRDRLLTAFKSTQGPTVDFGFGPGDESAEVAPTTESRIRLPAIANTLLKAQDNPLLIVYIGEPARLAQVAARRNWIGPLAGDVFASARSISVAVDEDTVSARLRVTFALEFANGDAAEAALKRLTSAQGDYSQLGFIAQPGYERVVRRTQLVVIRIDVQSNEAAEHLPPR